MSLIWPQGRGRKWRQEKDEEVEEGMGDVRRTGIKNKESSSQELKGKSK